MFTRKHLFVLLSSILTLASPAVPYFSKAAISASSAKNYLTSKPSSTWSVMAQVASGETPTDINFLKNISGSEAINFTAPILAISATGNNPKTFGSTDLVSKLKTFYNNNQLGDTSSLNDDIFGLLALISAGENPNSEIPLALKNYLFTNQNADGSWGFALGSGDTDMTAAGIIALKSAGVTASESHIQKALTYLKTNQTAEGGFLSSPIYDQTANSASTAWAVWALNALNISPESITKNELNPIQYLETTQNTNGSFSYTPGSAEDAFTGNITAYALIAVSGKTLPLKISTQETEQFEFRIEGKDKTVCEGHATGPTALDIVKNASASCGFTYNIEATQYGPYLNQIGNDIASGLNGWQYAIKNEPANVGAADFILKTGDSVLWYFGSWDDKITRASLTNLEIASGQSSTVFIEYLDSGLWKPLAQAKIFFGASLVTTNPAGQASLSANDGYYQIFGEKPGFVRSNTLLLKIGSPATTSSTLSATIGQVNGTGDENPDAVKGASFTINTENLDFGNLSKAQTAEKTLTLNNNGGINLKISSVVEGDNLFKENLKLQNNSWKTFETPLSVGQNQIINAKLSIPADYSKSGKKSGRIIFWAKSQE